MKEEMEEIRELTRKIDELSKCKEELRETYDRGCEKAKNEGSENYTRVYLFVDGINELKINLSGEAETECVRSILRYYDVQITHYKNRIQKLLNLESSIY